jgi:serine/threonine protein kinase
MGTAIFGRYVLIGAIGQGGVSTVYSAIDARRGRKLAIKIMAPAMADSPGAREDVQREALITDRLRHPSVPRVFEYGEAPLPDGTVVPFVVLELLTGVPLTQVLARGPMPWREAVRIAATVADVLAVAHRRGVVHRDLNARNVMVTSTGPKIIDFGLATAAVEGGVTRPPMLRGRPGRAVAPSHPKTAFARPADDVYTLGVLLYEMLAGRSPYPAAVAATILSAGRTPHLAPMPVLAIPGVPSQIRDLVRACMAKRPDTRPAAAEIALTLWAVLDTPANATIG